MTSHRAPGEGSGDYRLAWRVAAIISLLLAIPTVLLGLLLLVVALQSWLRDPNQSSGPGFAGIPPLLGYVMLYSVPVGVPSMAASAALCFFPPRSYGPGLRLALRLVSVGLVVLGLLVWFVVFRT